MLSSAYTDREQQDLACLVNLPNMDQKSDKADRSGIHERLNAWSIPRHGPTARLTNLPCDGRGRGIELTQLTAALAKHATRSRSTKTFSCRHEHRCRVGTNTTAARRRQKTTENDVETTETHFSLSCTPLSSISNSWSPNRASESMKRKQASATFL